MKLTSRTWRKTLHAAANYIHKHGLAKGAQIDAKGRVCIAGAISIVVHGRPFGEDDGAAAEPMRRMVAYLTELTGDSFQPANFNNDPKRKRKEVSAALRKCAGRHA